MVVFGSAVVVSTLERPVSGLGISVGLGLGVGIDSLSSVSASMSD